MSFHDFIKLKDLCIKKAEYGSGSKAISYDSTLPRYVRITDIGDDGKLKEDNFVSPETVEEKYFLEKNDLLFARSGSVGRTYLYDEEDGLCQFAGYLIRFKLDPKIVIPKYVFLFTKTSFYWNWVESQKKTMTISNINAKQYSELKIPIFSLDIQKEIVEKLEKIEEMINYRNYSLKNIDLLIQSIFLSMFEEYLISQNKDYFIKLKDLCIKKAEYGSGSKAISYDSTLPRYVRITDIGDDGKLKEDNFVSPETVEEKYFLEKNDLLFARSGSVGRTYLYDEEDGLCQFAGYLIRFKLDPKKILPKFLFYYTKTSFYWNWVESQKKTMTISNINAKQYSNLDVLIPPFNLQCEFVKILEQVEEIKKYQLESKKELENLFNNLMQKAFKGELIC